MLKNLPFKGYVYFSIVSNILIVTLIIAIKSFLPPVVPLFYGLPVGSDQLIPSIGLTIAPIAGLTIALINIFLSNLTRDTFLKKTLIVSSAFISLLVAIAVIKIILLVWFF